MTLANFIVENIEVILLEWIEFASTLSSGKDLDVVTLRNHARKMLLAVAADMATDQTDSQQRAKSRGEAVTASADTAAETHGDQRYFQGFKLEELIAEFRALRATVIRLWVRRTTIDERTVYELTRFNEGIDQLLAESVEHFSRQLDRARQLFLGVLGHDLRTDLQVILACADRLQRSPSKQQIEKYVPPIKGSAHHVRAIAEDLLDVVRTQLGRQLPIEVAHMDAVGACEEVLDPFQQLHPECQVRLQIEGDVSGEWDRNRIQQMLANLVRNAFQHGDPERPVTLSARGDEASVVFEVHNFGDPIPPAAIPHIFDPMYQGAERTERTSLGLGLYIASTIAQAHRGTLKVSSSEAAGTTFSARLPRHAHPFADKAR